MTSWRDPRRFVVPPDRLRALRHRWHRVVVLAAVTGAVTGLAIVAFESLTVDVILDRVRDTPDPLIVVLPAVGLTIAWLALRWIGLRASPSLADEYLREYHGRPGRSDLRAFAARILASIATLGSGGAMGFEGPSIYIGASIGASLQQRYRRFFTSSDTHVLLVAGAAAGVAAIFKAPATGAVFALEVPYQEDAAAHAALPALIGSAASYLVYVLFKGTDPLLQVVGNPGFDARDLLGALGLGVVCGLSARYFARAVIRIKQFQQRSAAWRRISVGGGGLLAVAIVALVAFNEPVTIGPGYQAIAYSLAPDRSTWLILLLFALEATATLFTVAGGGAGGLFIPLVVQGWLLGRVLEGLTTTGTSLFPVVGAAAYLGAGYRTPIAAVVFVTEATRGPGFIVPALLATAVSQLLMGRGSVANYQIPRRVGALAAPALADRRQRDDRAPGPLRAGHDAPGPVRAAGHGRRRDRDRRRGLDLRREPAHPGSPGRRPGRVVLHPGRRRHPDRGPGHPAGHEPGPGPGAPHRGRRRLPRRPRRGRPGGGGRDRPGDRRAPGRARGVLKAPFVTISQHGSAKMLRPNSPRDPTKETACGRPRY